MKELEDTYCEVRSVIDIQNSVTNCLNNIEGDDGKLSNDSQLHNNFGGICGGFLNDAMYAWLSYGCHLIVLNVKSGESISSWAFRGRITCVCQFPAQCGELPLLVVGLDNEATRIKDSMGLLCIFDCTSSRVLRAIKMPAGIEQVSIVSGGAVWEEFNDKRLDNILMQMDGIACVVLRNLHHLMIDLQRSSWEIPNLSAIMDETSPADIEFLTTKDSYHRDNSKHMACNLLNQRTEKHIGFNREDFESNAVLNEKLTNIIISSTKIGCLISGCLGRVIIWQNNGSVGWISLPVNETMIVTHLALLEPTDDPRPFYYLWVVFQDDSFKVPPLLRMFALLFERKYCDRGTNLYFNLEAEPSLKFEFELDAKDRVVNLSTIERGTNLDQSESEFRKGEDSLLLISVTNRTLLFDLNQWYKEQMPQTISECKNPNSILACYNTEHKPSNVTGNEIISCTYIPRTLQEFPNNSLSSSEELFYPNSLSFEWVELTTSKLKFWLTRGVQAELLREIALTGPIILVQPSEMFHKCLSIGLVPFNTEVSFSSDLSTQRDMLLSLCLEQRWATFLIRCVKEWSDGSAAYMYPSFLKWGIQRASSIKMIADRLCVPLFDQSGNNIGESEVKTLRFCYQQLECLSNVVAKLPFETSSLIKQRRALKRVSMYFQVLLWFYDVGLLPESQNLEENPLPISLALKIPYPFEKLSALYKEKRGSMKDDKPTGDDEKLLFIDELISRECSALILQWEKEAGDLNTNGYYPPPSLQSLLRSYLTDCDQTESDEVECKHQITIYLLMDLAMLLQGSYPGVDQLIKYPSSFKMRPSLIKLTQAFWLLDHEDYNGFLDMMTGQLVSDSDVKNWHHKLVLRTLIRNSQHKLALMYLRIKKPPLSSLQEHSTLIGLSVEHDLVQSAFHCRPQSYYTQLLMCFFQACKDYNKLSDILHLALDSEEEEMFIKFLENTKSENIKLLYYLQRCRYMEVNNGNSTVCLNNISSKNTHVDMLNAYSATLPDIMKRFSMNMAKTNLDTGLEPRYPRPMTHHKNFQKATNIYETAIKKARETYLSREKFVIPFITAPCATLKSNNDRIKIQCVMSPKVVQTNRKRTLDQVVHDEEEKGMRTPDRTKRRKLSDDSETALNAAFSTPLVKRKISSNMNTPVETPHSILKIRQLIRNSTSPTIGSVQGDITDNPISNEERKVNRQIRFNINRSKNDSDNKINDEVTDLNFSDESEDVFVSPAASEKSLTESAVLSDNSYTCKNIYTVRPRPSLRRTYLQTFTESINQSSPTCMRPRNHSNSPPSILNNCSRTSPQVSRRCTSMLTSSIHSTAILSPDSSFETNITLGDSSESDRQYLLKVSKQQSPNYNRLTASTPLIETVITNESKHNLRELMNVAIEEESVLETETLCKRKHSENTRQSNTFQYHENENFVEGLKSKYENGDLSKVQFLEENNKNHEDNGEKLKKLSNITENSLNYLENKEHHWSLHEKLNVKEYTSLKNDDHFDITDDESSNSSDEIPLIPDLNKKREEELKTLPMHTKDIYDASNITDDESDSNVEIIDKVKMSTTTQNRQENECNHSRFSMKKSMQFDNNSNHKKTRKSFDSPEHIEVKNIAHTSNLDSQQQEGLLESPEISPRITRASTRRASSVAKDTNASLINSPSKVPAKTTRLRRAGSLVKEVLVATVVAADENVKRMASSGLEESSGTLSPRRTKDKRASVSMELESEETKVPVRRITRRSASVQKELPESTKLLSKNSQESFISNSMVEDDVKKIQIETKNSKTKQSSRGTKKSSIASVKSIKESTTNEQQLEEMNVVKSTKRRSSSVPKESVSIVRTRRASSVVKETITEEEWAQVGQIINSPAANTRSRKSSVQSTPGKLEEILNTPSKETTSVISKKKQISQNSRQKRATSVELSQIDIKKRVKSICGKGTFEEPIMEEEVIETEIPANNFTIQKVPTKRKRAVSETSVQKGSETIVKPRRTRKPAKQDVKEKETNQFLFSQPEKTDNPPLDQKVIDVPKYMFSPPHTRSKIMAPDHRRRINSCIPILSDDEWEEEDVQEMQNIPQKTTEMKKSSHYIRVTVHCCKTKFVLPKKSKNSVN